MEKTNIVLSVLVGILLLVVGGLAGYLSNKPVEATPIVVLNQTVDTSAIDAKISELDAKISSLEEFEVEADEKLQNDTAKNLVSDEMSEKSFKKAIMALLNNNSIQNMTVKEYKDLTIVSSVIEDVELNGNNAEVETTIKVTGFNDGDDEDDFKVRLVVVFNIEGLDVDEIDEASVEDYSLVLEKVFD